MPPIFLTNLFSGVRGLLQRAAFRFEDHEHLLIEDTADDLDRMAAAETREEIDESVPGPADPDDEG
jgi:hypothetical protein